MKRICEWYFLDSIYDPETNIYIAKRLSDFNSHNLHSYYDEKKLIDVLSLSMLIPDVFSKQTCIDQIFYIIENNDFYGSMYTHLSQGGEAPSLGTMGETKKRRKNISQAEQKIRCDHILESSREYILYLSKIYLPILSRCFYVLFMEHFSNLGENEKIEKLYSVSKHYLLEHYNNKIEYLSSLGRINHKYLSQLYLSIYTNIFSDPKKYKDIKESLNLGYLSVRDYRLRIINMLIRTKVEMKDDLSDPIPYEHSDSFSKNIKNVAGLPSFVI